MLIPVETKGGLSITPPPHAVPSKCHSFTRAIPSDLFSPIRLTCVIAAGRASDAIT